MMKTSHNARRMNSSATERIAAAPWMSISISTSTPLSRFERIGCRNVP
jgi:hypothetical protein